MPISPQFPHMMPEDIPVWERWLSLHPADWDSIAYDVHVGAGVDLPDDMEEPHREAAIQLSKKRIDVVVTYPDRVLIIEVKKRADWRAIGQIMGYPVLFRDEFPDAPPIATLLVTESFETDIQHVMDNYELPYEILPETMPEHVPGTTMPFPLTS